ncbi:MAG: 16S rRNA (cytidine(1402)-2'-O)-methyltransferase [Elusimicrobia bacterium]|nr:16S rRNA (cytidine(1402)-2'-O)-methyltransferase [Elusimicrobiota bacterium]
MLYLVATPIGNLEDITLRAVKVLGRVKAVYCEDTRRTRILLGRLGISTPLLRFDEKNPRDMERVLDRLAAGEALALVSDSGAPVISDPGRRLVERARERGLPVCSLPGPCAAVSAVSGSGLPGDSFVFLGFLPRSPSKRRKALREAGLLGRTIAVYESPFRALDLLKAAEEELGPEAQAVVARELTKVHEEWLTGTIRSVREKLEARGGAPGEYVVLLHPRSRTIAPTPFQRGRSAGKAFGSRTVP